MTTQGLPLHEIDREGCYIFVRRATRGEILDPASNILETRMRRSETLQDPNEAKLYLSLQLGDLEREVFCCMFLDNRHGVIAFEKLFLGTIDGTSADEALTRQLKDALALVGVRVLDHSWPGRIP